MSISANAIFHFVRQREYLSDILKKGELVPRYCVEDIDIRIKGTRFNGSVAIPMKCFCDIPLSQIYQHTNKYGKFAIGLSKEWAQKAGITPVIYIHEKSPILNILLSGSSTSGFPTFCNNNQIIKYLKPYSGSIKIKKKTHENRFYDEREWRYVPDGFSLVDEAVFKSTEKTLQKKLMRNPIPFKPEDIRYIIVQEEKNREKVIEDIKKSKFFTTPKSKEFAISKILSVENIHDDL